MVTRNLIIQTEQESVMAIYPQTTIIKHQIKHPETGKRLRYVFVTGKGWYSWNTVYHVYNAVRNYDQLKEADRLNIDFSQELS